MDSIKKANRHLNNAQDILKNKAIRDGFLCTNRKYVKLLIMKLL